MRILQLHNRHSTRGGADEVVDLERDVLIAAGHEVEQMFTEPAGGKQRPSTALQPVWNITATRRLNILIGTFKPDVVHVHTPFPLMSPAVFTTAHRHRIPTVATCHSYRYSCIQGTLHRSGAICEECIGSKLKLAGLRHRCYHDSILTSLPLTTSLVLHRALGTFKHSIDRYLVHTPFARDILTRDGIRPDRIVVKPNAVPDPRRIPPSSIDRAWRDVDVAFVGRLVEEKGIRTLLFAAERAPAVRFTIAGDGPLRAIVTEAARRCPNVDFVGWLPEADVTALLSAAKLTVIPSEWYEAAPPLTLLRSLACGTPVICSDLDNICATVLAAGAGRSFTTGDAAALATALTDTLADVDGRAAAATDARLLYERDHTPEATRLRLESVYADLADAPPDPAAENAGRP